MKHLHFVIALLFIFLFVYPAQKPLASEPSPLLKNELEEIVVTAEFRDTRLMDSPKSISILTSERIRSRGATHLEESLNLIPNLNYSSGTSRARFFQIRGIGERSQFVEPVNPSVGVLIDDIDFTGAGTVASLFDVSQVEIFKGPQGTRYGANALAGLINIKTNDPTQEFESSIHLSAGHYDTRNLGVVLSGPLSQTISGRLAVQDHKSNGYINNAFLGRNDTNDRNEQTIRAKLFWEGSDTYSLKVSLFKLEFDNGYDAFSLDNTRLTLSDEPGHDRQDSLGISLKNTWNLPFYDLSLIIGTSDSELEYGYDEDWTYVGIHPWEYSSADNYIRDRKTASYEWRLVSNDESLIFNETTRWVLGFYGLQSEENLLRQYTFLASDYTSRHDFDTHAVYVQLDSQLSDAWSLSLGLRTETRRADYDTSDGVKLDSDDTLSGGRLTLKHTTNDTMTYVTLARGYKAGGFNTDGTLDTSLRSFDSEYLTEFEAGIKSLFMNGRLATRVALFYDDRNDQQVKMSLIRTRPDGSTEFVDFLDNAAEGTNSGLEIEVEWRPVDRLEILASLGLLQAEFDSYITALGENKSGDRQAHAPDYMYSFGFTYDLGQFNLQVSLDGKDSFYLSDRHMVQTDSFRLLNANLTYSANNLTVSLWGRNLTDKDYYVRGFGSFGNDPRKFYAVEPYFQFGEPRMVGVDLSWDFN